MGQNATETRRFPGDYVLVFLLRYNILYTSPVERKSRENCAKFWLTERRLLFYNEWHAMF